MFSCVHSLLVEDNISITANTRRYLGNMIVINSAILFLCLYVPWCNGQGGIFNKTEVLEEWDVVQISPEEKQEILSQMTMRFYYGPNSSDYYVRPLNRSTELMETEEFNNNLCTAVHMFGYSGGPDHGETRAVMEAYVTVGTYNPILVDWRPVPDQNVTKALKLLEDAAKLIAKSLENMVDSGMNMCHLSGHSLGAQCVGYIARNMKHRVTHLIGLDPWNIVFYAPDNLLRHISAADADCVEIVHTNAGQIGASERTGKLDYYPNGGTQQPGCPVIDPDNFTSQAPSMICNHLRSVFLWADNILAHKSFPACKTDGWKAFILSIFNIKYISYIGVCNKNSIAGRYRLRTNSSRPLGLGRKGI